MGKRSTQHRKKQKGQGGRVTPRRFQSHFDDDFIVIALGDDDDDCPVCRALGITDSLIGPGHDWT